MVKKTSGYFFRSEPLVHQIEKLIGETLASQEVKRSQIEELFWAVTKERGSCFSRNLKYEILGRMDRSLPSFKIRTMAFMAQGAGNIYEDEIQQIPTEYENNPDQHHVMVNTQFKEIVKRLEDNITLKQHQLKNSHDSVKLLINLVRMSKAYVPSEAFELLVGNVFKQPRSVKYADALSFFQVLIHKLPYIAKRNMSSELWKEFQKEVFTPVLRKMPSSDLARLLELVRVIGYSSEEFISELVAIIQNMAYDFNNQDFSRVAAGLLEIGGIQEFKRAMSPIITDLLFCEEGLQLISKQKNYDKRSRISFQSQDIVAKQRGVLNILWSVFALCKVDPTSIVAKKLVIAINIDQFKELVDEIELEQLTFEEYLKLSQIVQINEQLTLSKRSKTKSKKGTPLSIEWLKLKRRLVNKESISRWLDQDRLTPSSEALQILSLVLKKNTAQLENIEIQEKVLDFLGNQFHQLIVKQEGITAINIIPKRLYIGEDSKRMPLSETLRRELIKDQGIELREIQEAEVLEQGEGLEKIVKMK